MRIVKALIWLGFIALLTVSVPKVAWVFRSYEGAGPSLISLWGTPIDILWVIPLFVALCIDALILALTYSVSIDKAKASQFSMWSFVGLLCALSYYCNLLYNNAHAPVGSIWTNPFVSIVTPFVLSGVPLFALCYTLILSRIGGRGETLEEKATRLEQEKAAKERIREAKQGRIIGGIGSTIKQAITEGKAIGKTLANSEQNNPISQPYQEVKADDTSPHNGDKSEGITEVKPQENKRQTGPQIALTPDVLALINEYPKMAALISTGRKTATIEEVADTLMLTTRMVSNRLKGGTLKHAPRNAKLILIPSIVEWAKTLQKVNQNGHREEAIEDVLTLVNVS